MRYILFYLFTFFSRDSVDEGKQPLFEICQINLNFYTTLEGEPPELSISFYKVNSDKYELYIYPNILYGLEKIDTSYRYIIFHKEQKIEFECDSFAEHYNSIIKRDSFESKLLYNFFAKTNYGNPYCNLFRIDTLHKVKKVTYVSKKYIDPSYKDTGVYYFDDELKNLAFSIDKRMDSAFNSKLTKYCYQYLTPPVNEGTNKVRTLEREICVSFEPVKSNKLEMLVNDIIARYKGKFSK